MPDALREAAPPGPASVVDARGCFVRTAVVLAAFGVARALGLLGPPALSAALLVVVLAVIARRAHLSRDDLGLRRSAAGAGVRYGMAALAVVLAVLVVAAVLPATNGFLHDSRADVSGGRLALDLLVSVVLLTVLPEELAFRGVLLGSAVRWWGSRTGALVSSALFGLWHIAPTLHTASGNAAVESAASSAAGLALLVAGAVAVTFVAGLAFSWLRLRSGSLLAPVIAHCATNGLALTVAWVTLH